ncbi:hypothetical protein [Parabacteroides pacaensis]|uniref:hypothetical protein n=1 Tax=Parabacteroides pacaensis TaxID=2086575 RepID=UPI000D109C17|nr:hypothetical protein [Parabacteroides pacaensis]
MNTSTIKFANKLELHYYFNDSSNYLDAMIKHRCEKELLAFVRFIAEMLDVKMTVYCEPYKSGGFKEIWGIAGSNPRAISIVLSIVMQTLCRPLFFSRKNNGIYLDKDIYNEEKVQYEIAKFRKDLKLSPDTGGILTQEFLDNINSIPKICKYKSNFFEALRGYPKVRKISVRELNERNNSKSGVREVKRENFDAYILRSDELPAMIDNSATIEIISPVLKDSKYRWKGIYNKGGETIDFYMDDADFKEDMFKEKVTFVSGMCIDCVLEIERKLNELGDIVPVCYTVQTVIRTRFDKLVVVTPQGKRHLAKLKAEKQQLTLDLF